MWQLDVFTPSNYEVERFYKLTSRKLRREGGGGGKYLYFCTKMFLHSSAPLEQGWNLRASLQSLG